MCQPTVVAVTLATCAQREIRKGVEGNAGAFRSHQLQRYCIMWGDEFPDEQAFVVLLKKGKAALTFLAEKGKPNKKTRLCRRVEWQRPIFPQGCPCSIVGAGRLNYRVRDGNGCFPSAIVTTPPARTSE